MRRSAFAAAIAVTATVAMPDVAFAAPNRPDRPSAEGADLIVVTKKGDDLSLRFREDRAAGGGEDRAAGAGVDPGGIVLGPEGGLSAALPDDPAFAFLGEPGRPVWSLAAGGPRFPAIDTTGVSGGDVTLRLVKADGPGKVAIYTLSEWGRPTVLLDSDGRTSVTIPAGRRLGGVAWTFDTAGTHELTFAAAAGREQVTQTYTVEVPPLVVAPASAGTAVGRAQAATTGQGATTNKAATSKAATGKAAIGKAATSTTATGKTVISDGHVDMGPQLDGSTWRVRLKDDATTPATWRELADVTLKVTDKAKIKIPAGDGYAFLGATGDPVWLLPQTQQDGIVWPGWNTQDSSVIAGVSGAVTWTLEGVTGPGAFKLFLTSSFGTPDVLFDSARALPQRLAIPLNTHAHGNWAFTRAGTYRLAVRMSGTTKAGKAVSDTRTLTIAVGDGTAVDDDAQPGPGATAQPGSGATAQAGQGGALAKTGANVALVAAGGLVSVALGAVTIFMTRRRKPSQ
ncbi:TIGR03773 family transporter-associated surface protein [Actinoplanes sp. NBRC 101535]|uniref:TIGR03773 family transporter-associated surface protein n=1 Tax=Actinoplanes sp. NBRC 101535 TaxID=3032196 RepID=UPI0024A5E284|nr:TIGR03773 family transporter-associated surface protein [Actinoplanes sp. NBRC 101535]GLY07805.1 hypothetical protein Acsp01_81840 [Actinoplanes sp. NBRC 101535]